MMKKNITRKIKMKKIKQLTMKLIYKMMQQSMQLLLPKIT